MESPDYWNSLTAHLAWCDLARPEAAWEFLLANELVRNAAGDREAFVKMVRDEVARGEITGPSQAFRVAQLVAAAGLALPAALRPDPWGREAAQRAKA